MQFTNIIDTSKKKKKQENQGVVGQIGMQAACSTMRSTVNDNDYNRMINLPVVAFLFHVCWK